MPSLRIVALVTLTGLTSVAAAGEPASAPSAGDQGVRRAVLSPQQRVQVDESIDRALTWIARHQRADGAFEAPDLGQPGITSLCLLAFLARGHLPGEGPYGAPMERGVAYVLSCTNEDGLIALVGRGSQEATHNAPYNHSISALLLAEIYGMTGGRGRDRMRRAIRDAIVFTCDWQKGPKQTPLYDGGWRYLHRRYSSDLSVTSWQLMFLRSAKNVGFPVPTKAINQGTAYVERSFDLRAGTFLYGLLHGNRRPNRGMAGAGILSLSLAGRHDTDTARAAGDWLLMHPFDQYNVSVGSSWDRFHYGAMYCSHAMFQLGGKYWAQFYPTLVKTLLDHQHADGSWDPEKARDGRYGNVYTTALAVLALSPPYQLLPVFQR